MNIGKVEEKMINTKNTSPSGFDYSIRPNWIDLGLNNNDVPIQKDTVIIVTSWFGHLPFLKATLQGYVDSGSYVICAYDNPIKPWSSEDEFKIKMPSFDIWKIPHSWIFKHITYDNDKRNGWLWLLSYSCGIIKQFNNFKYILHVNGDCLWRNPKGLKDLKDELGENDLMSISSQENNIHTCAVIYKSSAFYEIFSFIQRFLSPPVLGSFSPEELLTRAVRTSDLKEKVVTIQPMELDNSSVDHYSRYDQDSTWKRCVGYINLGSCFLTSLIERTEPVSSEFIDLNHMKNVCSGYSDSLIKYYETKDRRWLYKSFDENEDSWYDRLYQPIKYYGESPIYEIDSKNRFEQIICKI